MLPLDKWIAFLASEANPNGSVIHRGPVPPCEFDAEEDLAACKSLGRRDGEIKSGKEGVVGNFTAVPLCPSECILFKPVVPMVTTG